MNTQIFKNPLNVVIKKIKPISTDFYLLHFLEDEAITNKYSPFEYIYEKHKQQVIILFVY